MSKCLTNTTNIQKFTQKEGLFDISFTESLSIAFYINLIYLFWRGEMVLALDIGGSNIRIAEVNGVHLANKKMMKTPKTKKQILESVIDLISSYKNKEIICIATAGFERDGKIIHALNMDFNDIALKGILQKKFNAKVYVENDANCAGLAELHHGVGRGKNNFVLLTLGTGIGGAVIIDKELYRGNGGAGEIGSMIMSRCFSNNSLHLEHPKVHTKRKDFLICHDIFEHLASGSASVKIAHESGLKNITSLELEERANKKDKMALKVYERVGYYLGVGLANLSYAFDPDILVLGGGFSRVKHIYPNATKTLHLLYNIDPKPKIVKARFGDDAGLIGAALLAKGY